MIISKNQSAFILGRLITGNIIVACKDVHTMKTRLKDKDGVMALKLNISKTYNQIE